VLAGLVAAEAAFGADINEKGFKVPRGVGVIQVRGPGSQLPTRGWGNSTPCILACFGIADIRSAF
jgi:hypothetical protein